MAGNYVVPQVLVFQEFNLVPSSTLRPLPAHIAGPHAFLRRYAETDERAESLLGYYNPADDTAYSWPGRPAGANVDETYTKVFIKDALLKYFDDALSSGSTITRVAGYNNRVRSASIAFADNGTVDDDGDYQYPKSASLGDRGAKVGDVARVRTADDDLWTYIRGFVGEEIAAVTGTATSDSGNEASQSASATVSQTAGPRNCVEAINPSAAAYNGLETGEIDETYTIEVISSSTGGDHTTARLRITSASGNDDVDDVTPAAGGAPTSIGTRGATLIFTYDSCDSEDSEELNGEEVAPADLIEGQVFELVVHQEFSPPAKTSGGTYTGTKDVTYIVEVTKGAKFSEGDPEITVSTNLGIDVSGPTAVPSSGTAVAVGTKGVTISFTGAMLRAGDKYLIECTAKKAGAYQTILLGHNLPVGIEADDEVALELYIRTDLELTEEREPSPPLVNWEQSATQITLKSGAEVYHSEWTVDDEQVALPIYSSSTAGYGKAYVEYRAWLANLCNGVRSINDVAELDAAISGALHPDNPLKWGVFKALSNSNGQAVKYTGVCDPDDVDSWLDVLAQLDGDKNVYGLVPLTRNQTVLDAWAAHVDAQSAPEVGCWRVCYVNLSDVLTKTLVSEDTSTDGEVVLAVLEDDPDTTGTQYTRLRVTSGNGNFITNGVSSLDVARFLFTTDGFGNASHTTFVIDEVISEDEVRLVTGHSVAVSTPQKVEIYRNLSDVERSEEIARTAGRYGSRRVRAVWPDVVTSGGIEQQGYHLCAALAGLASGVVSHQSLTNLEVAGFDDMARTVDVFNRSELNTMAGAGAWIVTHDPDTGRIYSRHALTTGDTDDVNEREEMVVRNVDAISFLFLDRLAPFIGQSNVVDDFFAVLRVEVDSLIMFLRSNNFIKRLGSQLVDGEITDLRQHTLLKDRVVLAVQLTIPYPVNNIEAHLVI